MKLTWYGQSAFRVDVDGAAILIDPFLSAIRCGSKAGRGRPKASRMCCSPTATTTISATRSPS